MTSDLVSAIPAGTETSADADGASCFIPPRQDAAVLAERALDAHRAIRYDALLQLIGEVQRRRGILEVAQVVASRWKHCANVGHWRLLCVYGQRGVLLVAKGTSVEEQAVQLSELTPYDAALWTRRLPQNLAGDSLEKAKPNMPSELADPQGVGLMVLPVQQGSQTIGMLSVLGFDKAFDLLDKKFIAQVAAAMATRIVAILTEQTLSADLLRTEHELMAQRHASILGRLVNGVAHELNTPLGVQIAACDGLNMLLEDREQISTAVDDIVETVQLVAQQAKRSANIVRRLKQISAASVSTPAQPTPMVEELRLILDSLPMVADTPLLEVVGSETAVCLLDRNALHAVVNELLDNIRVHAKVGDESPSGTITVASVSKNVEVTVSDNGPGIPADALARYFDPFFTTRQSQGHLGIGGYIVQNLVRDALNGSVRVDGSTERGGASVTLVFPGT